MNFWILFAIIVVLALVVMAAFAVPIYKQLKRTLNITEKISQKLTR